jgi:hypothetical protein
MSKLFEDIVLTTAILVGFLVAVYLSYALVVQGAHYPPTLIVTFLAIGTSALIYRFMGGLGGTEFQAGLLKLGGAAAFFVGTIWFLGDRLRTELNLYDTAEPFQERIAALEAQRDQLKVANRQQAVELVQLRKHGDDANCSGQCTIADIRKLRPEDELVQNIKRLVEGQEPPFVSTLREITVKVSVVAGLSDAPAFNICGDTLSKLNEGVEVPNPNVQLSRTLTDGSRAIVQAHRAGRIGEDVCGGTSRDFDVQINCPVATKLFSDRIASCAEAGSIRGATVSIASLAD